MRRGKFAEAEEQLDRLSQRYDRYPALVEAQVFLHQATNDHESCCQASKRLALLTLRDPDARLMYAQESMFCGRVGIALTNYRLFLQCWPDHANARKAKNALKLVEPECAVRLRSLGIGDADLEQLVMHEEALECIQNGDFEDAAQKCREILQRLPNFMAVRNNLALSHFQCGRADQALQIAQETCERAPDNRFAEAILGKLSFLNGRPDEAAAIADRIVVNPPTEPDSLAAAIELLGLLGRDEDVVVLSQAAELQGIADARCRALLLHYLAVAQCRLGDERAARTSWKKCLQAIPTYADAHENLDDLNSGEGHAPWAESISKWIPRAAFDALFDASSTVRKTGQLNLTGEFPAIATLIPALLDRGDPMGREMAMRLATADGSPAMLDALQQFALGSRGPDKMRHEALCNLCREGRLDAGPHRFFYRGEWTEVKLLMAEISWEPVKCAPELRELFDTGADALNRDDFALAEESFNTILDKEPDNCIAAYNQCVVWLKRDGKSGRQRAQARLEELHERFPDYAFARLSLAQFAAMDGDFERAATLIGPMYDRKQLLASEATALFTTQIQIAIARGEFGSAEQTLSLLADITGQDDPCVADLRRRIDQAAGRNRGRSQWLSRV